MLDTREPEICCETNLIALTLWDPMDCSLPGSSLHGILQARVLEWVAISFSSDLPDQLRHEFEQALGVGDGQGSLECCSPWGLKESDTIK